MLLKFIILQCLVAIYIDFEYTVIIYYRGVCVNIKADYHVNYTMVFKYTNCYYCVKLIARTVNVLEKIETPCVDVAPDEEPTVERVCRSLIPDQQFITLFSENSVPVSITHCISVLLSCY